MTRIAPSWKRLSGWKRLLWVLTTQKDFSTEEEPRDPEEGDCVWENMHRTRMLTEEDRYGHILPRLEWLFLGQIQMGFEELSSTGTKRTAGPLSTERDTCYGLLREHVRGPELAQLV